MPSRLKGKMDPQKLAGINAYTIFTDVLQFDPINPPSGIAVFLDHISGRCEITVPDQYSSRIDSIKAMPEYEKDL